ncbi:MAG: hypothetical protein NVSMB31_01260 [Vulcanimicrobiaceae bacterium]
MSIGKAATTGDIYSYAVYQSNPSDQTDYSQPLDLSSVTSASYLGIISPNGSLQRIVYSLLTLSRQSIANKNGIIMPTWVVSFKTTPTTFPKRGAYQVEGVWVFTSGQISRSRSITHYINSALS